MTKERAIKVIDCILNDTLCDGCIGEETTSCVECRREVADMAIEALQVQKTGKWIFKNDLKQFFCDKCAEPSLTYDDIYIYGMELSKFCPNCGARMERES